jgi:hypothetical protein
VTRSGESPSESMGGALRLWAHIGGSALRSSVGEAALSPPRRLGQEYIPRRTERSGEGAGVADL